MQWGLDPRAAAAYQRSFNSVGGIGGTFVMNLKPLIILGVVVILAFIGVTTVMIKKSSRPERPPMTGDMAEFKPAEPPVPVVPGAFVDADGKPHDLSGFKGKFTLVNFWATWCAPCVSELPSLDRLARKRYGDNFQVVTISEDHGGKVAIEDFYKKLEITSLPEYSDAEAVYGRLLNFDSLPTTILLDPDGNELGRYDAEAVAWDGGDAWKVIDYYMSKQKKAAG
jgi:thiol-disulfide isomerase/thioredoxin